MAHPPPAICPVIKARRPRAKGKGKGKGKGTGTPVKGKKKSSAKGDGKGNGKGSAKGNGTPVKGNKASFKRKAGFNRHELSPFAKKVLIQRRHALPPRVAKVAASSAAAPADDAPVAAPVPAPVTSPSFSPPKSLKELIGILDKCKVPKELHPDAMPSGAKGFTKRHPSNPSSVQVLWAREMFYLNYDRNGVVPLQRTITWNLFGGADLAWDHCRKVWHMF